MKLKIDGTKIVFTFDGLDPLVFDATKAHADNRAYAEMHGWNARLRDNAALSRKQRDGTVLVITEAMRRDAVAELVAHYEGGAATWETRATKAPAQNPGIVAIAAKRGCTYAEAEAWFNEKLLAEVGA